jgi:hypothetical protein
MVIPPLPLPNTILGFYHHAISHWGDTCAYIRDTIHRHDTIRTSTNTAIDTPWSMLMGCIPKGLNIIRQQRCCDHFAFMGWIRLSIYDNGYLVHACQIP